MSEWISVKDRLPGQHDSMFAKFKGTNKWANGMFEKTTSTMIVTIEIDGKRIVTTGRLNDSTWRLDFALGCENVIAWMPLPKPYKSK